jgi:acyl dehydratase
MADSKAHDVLEPISRMWEDVEVGETLPTLEFPITIKTMGLALCGTRDFSAYHHDRDYSRAVGNPDMFVNTMFNQALFARFVTDWSGPESDFRETTLQMRGVFCPGDAVKLQGKVVDKATVEKERTVTIEITASNEAGVGATGTAVLAMPSRADGAVTPVTSLSKPVVEPNPELPDFARAWLGQEGPPERGGYPVSEVQIMYWCDMVEDGNPLYIDGDYARKSRHQGLIAPQIALMTWGMPRAGHWADENCPEREFWPPKADDAPAPLDTQPPGVAEAIVQSAHQTYGRVLRLGDRIYQRSELLDCSPLKETRVGPGYFQKTLTTYYDQNDEIVGTEVLSMLWYGESK